MAARTAPFEASQIYSIRLANGMQMTKLQLAAVGDDLGFCLGNARDRPSYASTGLISCVLDQHIDQYLHGQILQRLIGLFDTSTRWTKTDLAEELPSSPLADARKALQHQRMLATPFMYILTRLPIRDAKELSDRSYQRPKASTRT